MVIINPKTQAEPYNFEDWLPYIAQDMIWFNIQAVGDYLVVGRRGCRYPVDKDIFEELHVEIDPN